MRAFAPATPPLPPAEASRSAAGLAWVLGAATAWGLAGTLAKLLFRRDISPLVVVETRVAFSFVIMLLALLVASRRRLRVARADLGHLALLGVIGIAGSNFTYYFTIRELGVASAILLQYTAPALVVLWGTLVEGERWTAARGAALGLALGGCALAIAGAGMGPVRLSALGLATGAASAVCYAFFNIYGRRHAERLDVWTSLLYMFGFATLFWALVVPFQRTKPGELSMWPALVAFAAISVLIPYFCYYRGLARISASRAITASTWEPIVAIASAAVLAGERPGALQIAGAAAVVAAVFLVARRQ